MSLQASGLRFSISSTVCIRHASFTAFMYRTTYIYIYIIYGMHLLYSLCTESVPAAALWKGEKTGEIVQDLKHYVGFIIEMLIFITLFLHVMNCSSQVVAGLALSRCIDIDCDRNFLVSVYIITFLGWMWSEAKIMNAFEHLQWSVCNACCGINLHEDVTFDDIVSKFISLHICESVYFS